MYYWRVHKVLARGKRNSCLVRFPDGVLHVTSRWYVRRRTAASLTHTPGGSQPPGHREGYDGVVYLD